MAYGGKDRRRPTPVKRGQRGLLGISLVQGIVGLSLVAAVGGYITYCEWAKNDRDAIITKLKSDAEAAAKQKKIEVDEQKRINQEQSDDYKQRLASLTAGYDSYIGQLRLHTNQSAIADALPTGTSVDEELVCLDRAKLAEQMAGFERRAEEGLVRILSEGDQARLVASRCLQWQRDQRKASQLIRGEDGQDKR